MDTLIHADIFFFVTTIAVALVALLFILVIIYVIRILNDFHYISAVVRRETDLLAEDIDEVRAKVKQEGVFGALFTMISRLFNGHAERSKAKKQKNEKK